MHQTDKLNRSLDPKLDNTFRYIQSIGKATVVELSRQLGLSESTIRRNLTKLASKSLINRYHGGATLKDPIRKEPPVESRLQKCRREKQLIAQEAASLVKDGETIIMRSGSTVNAMAQFLREKKNLTIITDSLAIIPVFEQVPEIRIILLGGDMDYDELCTTGYLSSQCLNQLTAEKLFLGVRGVHPKHGIMADDFSELEKLRKCISCAKKVIILADNTKLKQTAPAVLCKAQEVDVIITDSKADEKVVQEFIALGVEVKVCTDSNGL